ncbi:MAG TPA: PAC2 family protein [Tepidisphaeraceae bacterium]|nr:PAC2 family protein [Tepidisphaeraceae bacterium]
MPHPLITSPTLPALDNGAMLLAFSGWMDGGEVSTGTVKNLLRHLQATKIAAIDPDPFYIYNFPGSMEVSALFRPNVKYKKGVTVEFDFPTNAFFCSSDHNLILFTGKEPNLRWREFGDSVFTLAKATGVRRIYFVGSFGGTVPHTREPRLFASVSDKKLRPKLRKYGVKFTDYEGPASFSSYLLNRAGEHDLQMINFAAEIPAYIDGVNPLSIESVTRRLASILELPVDLSPMRVESDEWTAQVTTMLKDDKKLAGHVRKLEDAYDTEMLENAEDD